LAQRVYWRREPTVPSGRLRRPRVEQLRCSDPRTPSLKQ
jgi:hypothetical protein